MKLDVLICTLGDDGIKRVASMSLPEVEGVRYLVSWQKPDMSNVPTELVARRDVKLCPTETLGLSNNRNVAIAQSDAEICLFADDDLRYTPDGLRHVIEVFAENGDLDIATFRHSGDSKWFPDEEFDLKKSAKGYFVTSFEIAARRKSIENVRFNPNWGIGAEILHAGEEQLFLYQALRSGLKGRYFPITIVEHCGLTTANRPYTRGVLMSQGAYLSIEYRGTALMRIPLMAWRSSRRGLTRFFTAVRYLFEGYIYGLRHFDREGNSK